MQSGIEDMAEFAIAKVMEAGAGMAKNVMNFFKELDEVRLQ